MFLAAPIIKGIKEHYCLIDEPIKMSMEVEGDPKPTVNFFKDDQKIVSNNLIKTHEDGNVYTLEFLCAQFRNSGKTLFNDHLNT